MMQKICDWLGRPKISTAGEQLSIAGRLTDGWFSTDDPRDAQLDTELMKKEGRYKGSYVPPEESTDGYYGKVLLRDERD